MFIQKITSLLLQQVHIHTHKDEQVLCLLNYKLIQRRYELRVTYQSLVKLSTKKAHDSDQCTDGENVNSIVVGNVSEMVSLLLGGGEFLCGKEILERLVEVTGFAVVDEEG